MSASEPTHANRWSATQWAWGRLLLDAFARAGVEDVVLSPGSRSAPFVLAAHEHPDLRCHDILDERSAGFFALGQAKVSGRPSLLICTSGSAAAHYLPAVMEASTSHAPLLVLTADRPFELQECGANQTVDQLKLYGSHVRRFYHLGRADSSEPALRALRRVAAQATEMARAPLPGPVHLNAPARKPLEPGPEPGEGDGDVWLRQLEARCERLLAAPVTRVSNARPTPDPDVVRLLAEVLSTATRPLMICGPATMGQAAAAADLRRLAARVGMPIVAEATSQLRFGDDVDVGAPTFAFFDLVFRSEAGRRQLEPDTILQIGAAPASTGLLRVLGETADSPDAKRIVVAAYGWPDPESYADLLVRGDPGGLAAAVVEFLGRAGSALDAAEEILAASDWVAAVEGADAIACEAIERELGEAGDLLTEGSLAREVPRALPANGLLALGNSLPVRQVDAWCAPGRGPLRVLSQRGLSGIDGLVSGAAGAVVCSGRPTALLVGDVSFLHDLNGLAAARDLPAPLAVVVVNNDGGRIFEELPIASRPGLAGALPHFTTPPGASIEHAAAVYGHRYALATTVSAVRGELERALSGPGCTVVEARVPPHGAAEQNGRVRRAVDEALQRAGRGG